jgi:hypothetical protein
VVISVPQLTRARPLCFGKLLDHGADPRTPADEPVTPNANTDPTTDPNIPKPNRVGAAGAE